VLDGKAAVDLLAAGSSHKAITDEARAELAALGVTVEEARVADVETVADVAVAPVAAETDSTAAGGGCSGCSAGNDAQREGKTAVAAAPAVPGLQLY